MAYTPPTERQQYSMDLRIADSDVANWQRHATAVCECLAADMRQRGLTPIEAPPLPPQFTAIPMAEIVGPFRCLCMYVMFPVIGSEDEPDEDGNPVLIYGDPCFMVRVDTLVAPASV